VVWLPRRSPAGAGQHALHHLANVYAHQDARRRPDATSCSRPPPCREACGGRRSGGRRPELSSVGGAAAEHLLHADADRDRAGDDSPRRHDAISSKRSSAGDVDRAADGEIDRRVVASTVIAPDASRRGRLLLLHPDSSMTPSTPWRSAPRDDSRRSVRSRADRLVGRVRRRRRERALAVARSSGAGGLEQLARSGLARATSWTVLPSTRSQQGRGERRVELVASTTVGQAASLCS
jgi:hypothetical protein